MQLPKVRRLGLKRPPGRTAIFWLEVLYLFGLGILAAAYLVSWIEPRDHIGSLPIAAIWFGAVGAVLLSLTGVFDHPHDWDDGYLLWHIARPLVGATVAVVAVLIVQAGILAVGTDPAPDDDQARTGTTDIFYYLVAFLVGYREETFRAMVKRLGDVVLQPSAPAGPAPTITGAKPAGGSEGTNVTIVGTGLQDTRTVRFGTEISPEITIVSDSEVTARAPAVPAGTEVMIVVTTLAGSATGQKFVYV